MTRGQGLLVPVILLALMLAGHTVFWWCNPYDFLDDIDSQHYAWLASQIVDGEFTVGMHPFNDRLGTFVPNVPLYAAFGVSARTTTLWPLIASLLTIIAVFATAYRAFGGNAALLAALLLASNVIQLDYSTHLLPDIVVSLLTFAGTALLFTTRGADRGALSTWLRGGAAAAMLVAGLVTKTTVVWAVPFFAGTLLYDLWHRQNFRLWTAIATVGTACLGILLFCYWWTTGNPLHVVHTIEETHNEYTVSGAYRSSDALAERLAFGPLEFFMEELGYGPLLLLAVPGLVHALRPLSALPAALRFWGAYVLVVLLAFWYGSTSLRFYNPLPASPRYLMPLLPPLAILAAGTLMTAVPGKQQPRRAWLVLVLAAIGFAWAAWGPGHPLRTRVFGSVAAVLVLLASPARSVLRGVPATVLWCAVVALLSVGMVAFVGLRGVKHPNPLRVIERRMVQARLARLPQDAVVFADQHSAFALPMMLARDGVRHVRVANWSDAAAVHAHGAAPAFVLVNQTTLTALHQWWRHPIPSFARKAPPHWKLLAERPVPSGIHKGMSLPDRGQKVLLYEIPDPGELRPN